MKKHFLIVTFLCSFIVGFGQTSKDYLDRAAVKIKQKDFKGAISEFTKAIELNPNSEKAFVSRGLMKDLIKDYPGAIADYSKGLEINPGNKDIYNVRGIAKVKLDDYRGAMLDFEKGKDVVYPQGKEEFFFYRGLAKTKLKDFLGGVEDYDKAIALKSNYGAAYYNRGISKLLLRQKDNGCLDLSKAGELGVSDAYDSIRKFCN